MPEQLGRIERLEAERYRHGKKLYVVPLVYTVEGSPDEYKEKCSRYWQQVAEHLANLAAKIGRVARVYHESIFEAGEHGLRALERLNPNSYQIAKAQCDSGASFEAVEERELFEEVMDWERCLMFGFLSNKVASKVSELYAEAVKKRNESIARKIGQTLEDDEAGLLFITERHSVQFPGDVEVFSIFPPALDEIHRWLRDQATLRATKFGEEEKREQKAEEENKEAREDEADKPSD